MACLKRGNMAQTVYDISVIICAYTEDRWDDLVASVKLVQQQTLSPREIIVVVQPQSEFTEASAGTYSGRTLRSKTGR